MTPPTIRAAALAAGVLWLPGLAAAQSGYCLDTLAMICGDLPVNQCMVAEDIPYLVPGECVGDVQMLFEMANEYDQQAYDPGPAAPAGFDQGYSFGGNLRNGPGDEYPIVGSLPEGAYVALSASGTWSGGYQWFYVDTDYGSAYHWGGLMCSLDYYVDGVLQVC